MVTLHLSEKDWNELRTIFSRLSSDLSNFDEQSKLDLFSIQEKLELSIEVNINNANTNWTLKETEVLRTRLNSKTNRESKRSIAFALVPELGRSFNSIYQRMIRCRL